MKKQLGQYMTPLWAAHRLWAEVVAGALPPDPVVVEPMCGDGRTLAPIPAHIPAYGAEIDPELARRAVERTGRPIFVGDFFDWELPPGANVAWGNPPFRSAVANRLMDRLAAEMPDGSKCWFVQPAYYFQTPRQVLRWNRAWTMQVDMLPRTLWRGLETPIVFAHFTKDPRPRLRGLRLYAEQDLAAACRPGVQAELAEVSGLWPSAVRVALQSMGGRGRLADIYGAMLRRRPTDNRHWREMVRKVLYTGPFERDSRGEWAVAGLN